MPPLSRLKPYLWVAASALIAAASTLFLAPVERFLDDRRMSLRHDHGWPVDVVMVSIDDAAISEIGPWRWSRGKQAELLRRVHELGAKTIFYDVFLPVEEKEEPAEDEALVSALASVVLPIGAPPNAKSKGSVKTPPSSVLNALIDGKATHSQKTEDMLIPIPRFADAAAALGHGILITPGGTVREYLPAMWVAEVPGDRVLPAAPLVAWLRQRDLSLKDVRVDGDRLVLPNGRRIRLEEGAFRLDFTPRNVDYPSVSARDVMKATPDDAALRKRLGGKLAVVLLDNAYQTTDQPNTIMSPRTPGGLVHATALRTFESGAAPRGASMLGTMLTLFALAMGATPWLSRRPPNQILRAGLIGAAVVVVATSITVPLLDLFPPVAAPLLFVAIATGTLTASSVRNIDQERTQLRELLRQSGVVVRATEGSVVVTMGPGAETSRAPDGKTVQKKGPPKPIVTGEGPTREIRREMLADESGLLLSGDPLEHPVQLGRYEVQRAIGRGGMGAIFLAIDKDLARPVALKILSTADPSAFKRFRQEAMAVARIVHPNVVQIHEVGFDAQVPYLVMEYVPGGTVSDLIRDPEVPLPLPWMRGTRIIHCIAKGLGAAHLHGIVHRDIKPSNLLLVKRTGDEAKIADFGIAKLTDGENLTREGSFVGTVGYLSPEQAKGKPVDARSDVYSLGLTWYKLLTGVSAFEGTTAEVLAATVNRQTSPDPREYNPEIPLAVVEMVQRMTALDPAHRPRDCNVVAAGMAAIVDLSSP